VSWVRLRALPPEVSERAMPEEPEVKQALAKAEECAKKAALAKTPKDRAYYERMQRKWLGIADGGG
jgi:hypothetical protein